MSIELYSLSPKYSYTTHHVPLHVNVYTADTGEWVGPIDVTETNSVRAEWRDRQTGFLEIETPYSDISKKLFSCTYSHVAIAEYHGRRQAYFPIQAELKSDEVNQGYPWLSLICANAWDLLTGIVYGPDGSLLPENDDFYWSGNLPRLLSMSFLSQQFKAGQVPPLKLTAVESEKNITITGKFENLGELVEEALYATNERIEFVPVLPGESLRVAAKDYVEKAGIGGKAYVDEVAAEFQIWAIVLPYIDVRALKNPKKTDPHSADAILSNTWTFTTERASITRSIAGVKLPKPKDAPQDYVDKYEYVVGKTSVEEVDTAWGYRCGYVDYPEGTEKNPNPVSPQDFANRHAEKGKVGQSIEATNPEQFERQFGHRSVVGPGYFDVGHHDDVALGIGFWAPMYVSGVVVEYKAGGGITVTPEYTLPDQWYADNRFII